METKWNELYVELNYSSLETAGSCPFLGELYILEQIDLSSNYNYKN